MKENRAITMSSESIPESEPPALINHTILLPPPADKATFATSIGWAPRTLATAMVAAAAKRCALLLPKGCEESDRLQVALSECQQLAGS